MQKMHNTFMTLETYTLTRYLALFDPG